MTDAALREAALASRAWPFEEARKLVRRFEKTPPAKGHVLFETGYGPSGLPHIGTFGEVARTTMVRHAFEPLTGPADAPHLLLGRHGRPAQGARQRAEPRDAGRGSAQAADARARPFGSHESFGAPQQRPAARLPRRLRLRLRVRLVDRVLPLRPLRRDAAARCSSATTRSWRSCCRRSGPSGARPIRPSCRSARRTGHVLQVPTLERNVARGTIVYAEPGRRARRAARSPAAT